MGSFWRKYIFFELKRYWGIIFHETEKRYKILRGIDSSFQNLSGISQNLAQTLESLKNDHFNGRLLSKVHIVWTKTEHSNNPSWNRRGIQNLERNRRVVSKLTQEIWQILTRALENLKNFHLYGFLLNKVYIYILFELKRYRGIIFNETKEGYKIWRGIDVFFQNWHKKFDKFWPDHSKVSKILNSMGTFSEKYILSELKKVYYRGLILHESEKGYKIWSRIDLSFQNWHKEFEKIWTEHSKVSKLLILMGSFWTKYIFFELRKYRGFP